jgi:hypothetical protein
VPLRSVIRLAVLCLLTISASAVFAQQVGNNVNMVTGTQWPGGDPFLQRQNEPSMAISSRNPLHIVAGDNDYRSVDIPLVSGESAPTGDAWLGFFTSLDGGQTWTSNLVPGYPQDTSLAGILSPIHNLGAGADPMVRAGTNGMFYYSGLAFNRQVGGTSKVFLASYTDDNNLEGSSPVRYLWTTTMATGNSNLFEDKPAIAVDIPRSWSGICIVPNLPLNTTQIFSAGTIYSAWTQFTGPESNAVASIMYSKSTNCGLTWTRPVQISGTAKTNQGASLAIDPTTGGLYIVWRVFASSNPTQADAIMYTASYDGGNTFIKAQLVANINSFDQGNTSVSFRTNDYPQVTVDANSRVYVAWSQRNVGNIATTGGDARIVVSTGKLTSSKTAPVSWGAALPVDSIYQGRGHQIMPGMAFSAGKLTVAWYDLRNDDMVAIYTALGVDGQFSEELENDGGAPDFPSFGTYIQDPAPPYPGDARLQTLDVRAAQAPPGNPPVFLPSVQVTNYPYGSVPGSSQIEQLQVDPPNFPMFESGTLPFFGDYIDVAGPTFIPNSNGTWRFNNQSTDPDFTHVVWADNRDVVPPADGNWANYTPPTYGTNQTSIFDPTQQRPACTTNTTGNTGDRNQNIYTAQLAPGLVLSSPGNTKPLGKASNGQLMQRQFAVVVTNTTAQIRYYQLTVAAQPTGGSASFLQFAVVGQPFPLTQIQVAVQPLSSTSRGLFVTSTVTNATVTINAAELTGLGGGLVTGGETAALTLNGDPNNPALKNQNIATTENYTPTIATPNIANPNIANPNIANPNIANPNIANPNIANPNIANPNIANQALSDGTITDGNWTITNTGNTSSAYSVNLTGQSPPTGVTLQLIVYQNYTTPLAQQCTLSMESHFVPVSNITNVTFSTLQQLLQPAATNPTLPGLALAPGQSAYITLRAVDSLTNNPAQALLDYNPITMASPAVVAQGANTGMTQPPLTLTVLSKTLPQATITAAYPAQTLQATGGSGAYTWSLFSGTLPPTFSLSSSGILSGTPSGTPGAYSFTAQVKDTANDVAQQGFILVINAPPTITTTTLSPGDQGAAYSRPLSATGGTPPLSAFSISSGAPPSGVGLSASNIAGTLAANATTSTFTVKITDANGVSATQSLTLTVNSAPMITTTSLPAAEQGIAYPAAIAASGGTGALSFTTQNIDGLTLTSAGTFTGTPTAPGNVGFTATVVDSIGVSASRLLTIVVAAPLSLNAANLPAGIQNAAYPSTQLVAMNGVGPYSNWVWTPAQGSSLPPGLSLNQSTGMISGIPTTAGVFSFNVSVGDSAGAVAMQAYSITVNASNPVIGAATLPNGQFDSPYSPITLTASGGAAPYTWTVGPGALPVGMTMSPTGTISGMPSQAGVWSVLVTVTDNNLQTGTTTFPLTVGLATAYAGSANCYMPYPATPMNYPGTPTTGPWGVTTPGALSGQMTFLAPTTITFAGMVNTNGATVTWASNVGGQNDQFVPAYTPSSITINNTTYPVLSVDSATSLTLAQSAGVQNFVTYSFTAAAGGNVMTGCLSGAITSGTYQLQFSAGASNFTLPLQVVAQNTQDNGTYSFTSEGVGNLPPSGFQQGVVTPGKSFSYLPGSYFADNGSTANDYFFFGYNGLAPQTCDTAANLANGFTFAAPPQGGRFDILFDGSTVGCPQASFPTSPAPITIASVDAVGTTVAFGSATITNVQLSSANSSAFTLNNNVLEIEAGGTNPNPVTVAFNYVINDVGCPGCIDQLQVGLNTDTTPQACPYSGSSQGSGSASVTINVPNTPGRYYLGVDTPEDYGCFYSSPFWANGQPWGSHFIGVVDVW